MKKDELLDKAIKWFRAIAEDMERITTGNCPHSASETKGRAIHAYEFLEKHKNDESEQEWNKKDIEMIDWLIRCCEQEHKELYNDKHGHQELVSDFKRGCREKKDWLESLKNKVISQNHWKPTKEQIMALRWIMNHLPYCTHKEKISELHEQLMKIYES